MPKPKSDILAFPRPGVRDLPRRILTPAEQTLPLVVGALVEQCGPVGAYNRLVEAAGDVRGQLLSTGPGMGKVLPMDDQDA